MQRKLQHEIGTVVKQGLISRMAKIIGRRFLTQLTHTCGTSIKTDLEIILVFVQAST